MPETTLTTWERAKLITVLGNLSGLNLTLLRKANGLLDQVELSQEEKESIGWKQNLRPNGNLEFSWTVGKEWVLEFDEEEMQILRHAFNQFKGWTVFEYDQVEELANKLAVNQ